MVPVATRCQWSPASTVRSRMPRSPTTQPVYSSMKRAARSSAVVPELLPRPRRAAVLGGEMAPPDPTAWAIVG